MEALQDIINSMRREKKKMFLRKCQLWKLEDGEKNTKI
jgi:hypothetical protein